MTEPAGSPMKISVMCEKIRSIARSMLRKYPERSALLMDAADRLEDQEERIAIMEEGQGKEFTEKDFEFPIGGD